MGTVGFRVAAISHTMACAGACEAAAGSQVDESLRVVVTADQDTVAAITWHDWAIGDEALDPDLDPLGAQEVRLEAELPTTVTFELSRSRTCAANEWSEDARVLLSIDGTMLEATGTSTAYTDPAC